MKGIVYGVGVGPGDPELMTAKAVRLIRENDVIAVPGKEAKEAAAYRIAAAMVPEIAEKELLAVPMPMTRRTAELKAAHRSGAARIEGYLERGRNVVFLTLGDPSVYSTFSYLSRILADDGYFVETVPGVPSFCAAAARLGIALAERDESVHVIPAAYGAGDALDLPGTCVMMKSAGNTAKVREILRKSGRDVFAVENCGMAGERIFLGADSIPDDAGYFTLIVAKERREAGR